MSEAELHLFAGWRNGAKRCRPRPPIRPAAYTSRRATLIDPGRKVSAAVANVFAAFIAAGPACGVVAACQPPIPVACLRWHLGQAAALGQLAHARVVGMLNSPYCAGAYVFGR
jgi:hypothetical protein